jgi:aminoglycoside phosphotransferase family enzyme
MEIRIPESIMKDYLEKKERTKIDIIEYRRLGSGWHGTGYKISYLKGGEKKIVILRTLKPEGFSHDYKADRARVFLLQHELSKNIRDHIRSLDVGGYRKDRSLVSLDGCEEFFQIVELAEGTEYARDLENTKERGRLSEQDIKKALRLSDYLADLHKNKYDKGSADSLYKRHLRDCIGHGEMLMGVLDTYPDKISWATKEDMVRIVQKAVLFREKIKGMSHRLAAVHGDFHPGNIIFSNDQMKVLDASREIYGDPADDITALSLNYIWFALKTGYAFSGPFKELFRLFWDNYIDKTGGEEICKVCPLFFAFRGVVIAHPIFYPDQDDRIRIKIFRFIKNVLNKDKFDPADMEKYLK